MKDQMGDHVCEKAVLRAQRYCERRHQKGIHVTSITPSHENGGDNDASDRAMKIDICRNSMKNEDEVQKVDR